MALSGAHVAFTTAAVVNQAESLPKAASLSENLALGSTTGAAAPDFGIVTLYSSADCYIAIGPSPDATVTTKRDFLPATTRLQFVCSKGDKVSAVAA